MPRLTRRVIILPIRDRTILGAVTSIPMRRR